MISWNFNVLIWFCSKCMLHLPWTFRVILIVILNYGLYLIAGGAVPFTCCRCWITPRWTHSYSMDFLCGCTFFYWNPQVWCSLRVCCWIFFKKSEKWKLFAIQPFWQTAEGKGSHGHYAFYQASLWFAGVLHVHCICDCWALVFGAIPSWL